MMLSYSGQSRRIRSVSSRWVLSSRTIWPGSFGGIGQVLDYRAELTGEILVQVGDHGLSIHRSFLSNGKSFSKIEFLTERFL
jgi:hypothetical protein